MIREIRNIPLAEGFEKIFLPGERELETTVERQTFGVPLSVNILNELEAVGRRYGVRCSL